MLLASPLFSLVLCTKCEARKNLNRKKETNLLFPYSLILGYNKGISPKISVTHPLENKSFGKDLHKRENEIGDVLLLRGLSKVFTG